MAWGPARRFRRERFGMLSNRETTALYKHLSAHPMDPKLRSSSPMRLMMFAANRTCGAILSGRPCARLQRHCEQRSRVCSKISISALRRHERRRWRVCARTSVHFGGSIGLRSPNASMPTAASLLSHQNNVTAQGTGRGHGYWMGKRARILGSGEAARAFVGPRAAVLFWFGCYGEGTEVT